ncbi:MAG TPA: ISAzo13 family transposase [Candidatus Scalindua sp.]|nr:ISAzo13 family transposase [Candidatus Scalindua sp.]
MDEDCFSKEWIMFFNTLSESQKRWLAAIKAQDIGYGGITKMGNLTGLSRTTITQGIKELKTTSDLGRDDQQVRSKGGGRKRSVKTDKTLLNDLRKILTETTAGDPMSSLKWTCKSVRNIAEELLKQGHDISYRTVHRLLIEDEYSLQQNRKTLSRENNPERDRQFKLINRKVARFLSSNFPVISVDAKKKEKIGQFENKGATWNKKGKPTQVEDHDFPSRAKGKATPYGAYDIGRNEGFVNVGISSDTAEFAVNSILRWWQSFGIKNYPDATELLICADGGGSNGSRNRLWKVSLQEFSNKTNLKVIVCHYPPGTSKWNKIEHRMFSYISSNWRGQPLESYEAVVQLIGNTTTKKGLKIKAKLDKRMYKKGKKITDEELGAVNFKISKTLPQWNYTICPN